MTKLLITIALLISFGSSVAYGSNVTLLCSDGPEYTKDIKIISNIGKKIIAKNKEGKFISCLKPQGK